MSCGLVCNLLLSCKLIDTLTSTAAAPTFPDRLLSALTTEELQAAANYAGKLASADRTNENATLITNAMDDRVSTASAHWICIASAPPRAPDDRATYEPRTLVMTDRPPISICGRPITLRKIGGYNKYTHNCFTNGPCPDKDSKSAYQQRRTVKKPHDCISTSYIDKKKKDPGHERLIFPLHEAMCTINIVHPPHLDFGSPAAVAGGGNISAVAGGGKQRAGMA
jgi:hypothetical protein